MKHHMASGKNTCIKLWLDNINVFLPADMKSIVPTHTSCTTQVDRNIQNGTFYNGIGG